MGSSWRATRCWPMRWHQLRRPVIGRLVVLFGECGWTGDAELASLLAEAVDGVIEHHVHGTRFGIAVDPNDGLLSQGAPGWALTWMDARVDGRPITPRPGKAVEVNALWINALGTAASLRAGVGLSEKWSALAAAARTSFAAAFTRPDGLGLSDLAGVDDCSIRPNQLLALSLPYGPGGPSSVVDVCRSQLLTSVGLRSLGVTDPAYIGRHRGDVYARHAAAFPILDSLPPFLSCPAFINTP